MHSSRRAALLIVVVALAASSFAGASPVGASTGSLADRAASLGLSCSSSASTDGVHFTKCSGEIPSFDGIRLDLDLSIPSGATRAKPTIVMLHGWSGDKNDWEADSKAGNGADRWHWNNVWFVSRGWVVLNYTARGFKDSCGSADDEPNCPDGYTHLATRGFETRDSQRLLGKLVDAGIARPDRLASTGGSYGGGQTWLLATSLPWQSPKGRTLQLAAGVAKYPWTDLLDQLAYNGRATDSPDQSRSHVKPIGIAKESYIDGLYATGRSVGEGRYDENPNHPGNNIDMMYGFVQSGEPYESKPNAKEIVRSFIPRSPYRANQYLSLVGSRSIREVPMMSIQGWTDPLFPAVETLQMFRKLEARDPGYPITMAFGDIGHSNAANPPTQWHPINALANRFLDATVLGRTAERPRRQAYSFRSLCDAPKEAQKPVKGKWDSLARGMATGVGPGSEQTASSDPNAADGPASDPLTRTGCISEDAATTDPGGAYWSFKVPGDGLTLLGLPAVQLHYDMTGQDATVAFKLWDVAPSGAKTLVTRGGYRISTAQGDPAAGRLRTKLFGNHWRFPGGHVIELQITQNDHPYLRPDNEPSTLTFSQVTLRLPTRQIGARTLPPA